MSRATLEYAVETGVGIKLADPKPAYCSNCHNSDPDGRYVAFPAAHDSGSFVNPPAGAYVASSDDLNLCEACIASASEVLGFKAVLHANQRQHIKKLEVENAHWKDYAQTLEATLKTRPETTRRDD